jgi:hypothetical protein
MLVTRFLLIFTSAAPTTTSSQSKMSFKNNLACKHLIDYNLFCPYIS